MSSFVSFAPVRRAVSAAAVAAAVAAMSGCVGRELIEVPQLVTDSSTYTAIPVGYDQVVVNVLSTFHNRGASAVTFDRCFPNSSSPIYFVGVLSPFRATSGYNPVWACVEHHNPIVVAPGETRTDTIRLHGPNEFSNGQYQGTLEGTFQLSYGGEVSNTFTIKLPPGGIVPAVPRDLGAAVQTDSLIVHMKRSGVGYTATAPLHVSLYNPRADTSFIVNCNGEAAYALEEQVNGEWINAWNGAFAACLSAAIVVPPSGHADQTILLFGAPKGGNVVPAFTVDAVPGVYRIVFTSVVDAFSMGPPLRVGAPIPVELRRSNPFAIVVDP